MLNIHQEKQKKAIAYYRHSAEDKQEYSVAIQKEHTEKFAHKHNIEIIHEEADEGKTGLLAKRPGFENLFKNWIENPKASKFDYVLVYDVSRWGRFQEQDQSAYFAHLCRKNGKEVVYVSLGIVDAESRLFSSLEISLHRYMAAEYSRQLSEKVFYGSMKISEQGYSVGGTAVFGMARQLLDVNKNPIRILSPGEHKQIANERVSFTPKEDVTTDTVREIFNLFAVEKFPLESIITHLDQKEFFFTNGMSWNKSRLIKILTDETYIGTRVYNKTWRKLKQQPRKNPRSEWVIVPNAFKGIVEESVFQYAQERLYWMLPNYWRKGINAIKRVRKNVLSEIVQWLVRKGLSSYESTQLAFELPIIFAVKIESSPLSLWCFVISEEIRKFDNILAISVVPENQKKIDNFFLFSTQDFTCTNYLILLNNSALYHNSRIEEKRLEEIITLFIEQLKRLRGESGNLYNPLEKTV